MKEYGGTMCCKKKRELLEYYGRVLGK